MYLLYFLHLIKFYKFHLKLITFNYFLYHDDDESKVFFSIQKFVQTLFRNNSLVTELKKIFLRFFLANYMIKIVAENLEKLKVPNVFQLFIWFLTKPLKDRRTKKFLTSKTKKIDQFKAISAHNENNETKGS